MGDDMDKVKEVDALITPELSIDDKFIIVRKGKKKYTLVNLI